MAGTPVTLTAVANDRRYNSNGWGTEPVQSIIAARYTVDVPSWSTGVVTYSMTPSDGAFSASVEAVRAVVDTRGWTGGRHLLLVESRDALGNWGVPSAVFLRIAEQYGVVVSPTVAAGQANPGQTISYTLRVTNTGNVADTFDVVMAGNAWPTGATSAVGPLAAGSSTELDVVVTVPETAMGGTMDAVEISVTSRGDSARHSTSVLTTTANVVHRVALEPMAAERSGEPGTTVTYTLRLTNTGNAMETFTLGYSGNTWSVQLSPPVSVTLTAGAGSDVVIRVMIPPTVTSVLSDTVLVEVTGVGVSKASALTTRVVFHVYLPVTFRHP